MSLPSRLAFLAAAWPGFALAQAPGPLVREAFVIETDGTAEKRLASVAEYAAQERWDAAVSLTREVATARPEAVVRVSPRRSLALPLYCDVLLSRLPKPGVEAYRKGADALAAARLAEAAATGDERALRAVADGFFLTSSGDDAADRLAERAWERGEFDLARRYWTALVPLGEAPAGRPTPAALRYPDTDLDLAAVRAKLALCAVALGEQDRAAREVAAFRRLHPEASGRLAGREGRLADLLQDLLAGATHDPARGETRDWTDAATAASTETFGQSPGRSGRIRTAALPTAPVWFQPLPPSAYATEAGPPTSPAPGPQRFHPVVWKDKTFVADADRVYGFELATGEAAWSAGDGDPGVLYPPADPASDPFAGERAFAAAPLAGVVRHTLTVHGDRLYARLGSPVTSPAAREQRKTASTIVCLDLAREGRLAWSLSSDALGGVDDWWAFEGPPVADRDRLYLLATRSRPQAQLNAICLDAATGGLLWNRRVGAPITLPPEGLEVMTHRLAAAAAGRLYLQTNCGAVVCLDAADGRPVWVGWYESDPPWAGPAATAPDRHLPAACLFSCGVLVAAPADSDRLFGYDAETGIELWSRRVRGGGRELLGVKNGVLVVSGERLAGLDLFSGRDLWTLGTESPSGFGSGRGLIAGPLAYWPARDDLFVADVETGALVRRLPLAGVYALSGGGNLAAGPGRLLVARPDGLLALGTSETPSEPRP